MDHDIVLLHRHFDSDHLEAVKTQMREMGPPAIRAIWVEVYGVWFAVEGCHRLRACVELGFEPTIEEIDCPLDTLTDDLGLDGDRAADETLEDLLRRSQTQYCQGRTVTFRDLLGS